MHGKNILTFGEILGGLLYEYYANDATSTKYPKKIKRCSARVS